MGHPIVTETDIDVLSSVIRQSEASITAMKTVVQVNVCAGEISTTFYAYFGNY